MNAVDMCARVLSVAVDVAAWALDRFADVARPVGGVLIGSAEAARWWANALRCMP